MTKQEIHKEMLACKARLRVLQLEVQGSRDKYEAMSKIDEATILQGRLALLECFAREALAEEFEQEHFITRVARAFARG